MEPLETDLDGRADAADATARIMAAVGRPVVFRYPGDEGDRAGVLKDRVVFKDRVVPRNGVVYYDVIDLIEFNGEPEPWIRITYYRHLPDGRLIFAGQTSICEPASTWAQLMTAARTKAWFPIGTAQDGRLEEDGEERQGKPQ